MLLASQQCWHAAEHTHTYIYICIHARHPRKTAPPAPFSHHALLIAVASMCHCAGPSLCRKKTDVTN